jgi:hypothetical protein
VRLRDNYELKKDEYLESQKRLRVLEERIEELRRKNLMFPTEKVEELLKNLKRKNAEIYLQRAKKLYAGGAHPRTRLLEWELRGLEVRTRYLTFTFVKYCGSGSVCFWASWIRILLSSSKKS